MHAQEGCRRPSENPTVPSNLRKATRSVSRFGLGESGPDFSLADAGLPFANRKVAVIDHFDGEYGFLSNFWPSPIVIDRIAYPTVEHAYQAAKADNRPERQRISALPTPGSAKRAGSRLPHRHDWDAVKIGVMEDLLRRKFSDPDLADRLIATGDEELVEGNTWNDRFWGVCRGEGRNELGKILMKVRADLLRRTAPGG